MHALWNTLEFNHKYMQREAMTKFEWAGTTYVEYIVQMLYSNNALRRKSLWLEARLHGAHCNHVRACSVCLCVCLWQKAVCFNRDSRFEFCCCCLYSCYLGMHLIPYRPTIDPTWISRRRFIREIISPEIYSKVAGATVFTLPNQLPEHCDAVDFPEKYAVRFFSCYL